MAPDPLLKNVLRLEEPDGGSDPNPGGSVSNAAASVPTSSATSNNKRRRSSSIGKLMGGADAMENSGGEESESESESPPVVVGASKKATDFFPDKAHVTDALRTVLAGLDASDLTLVYEKHNMPPSDRNKGQHRLLMSCKCELKRAAFASVFTETEMPLVHLPAEPPLKTEDDDNDDHGGKGKGKGKGKKKDGGEDNNNKQACRNNDGKHKATDGGGKEDDGEQEGQQQRSTVRGLAVQAYDCDGRAYKLNLKYLSCNTAYRIIGPDWTVFLENNGLLVGGGVTRKRSSGQRKKRRLSLPDEEANAAVAVEQPAAAADDIQMELWAFRSPKLSIGEIDQPGGALGLLLLHYRGGGEAQGTSTEEVQVAAPQDQEVVEQPRQHNSHGVATQAVAAGGCAGVDAAPRSTRDMPLTPTEMFIAGWLSFH